jgi:SAM-dependent methyltransferase
MMASNFENAYVHQVYEDIAIPFNDSRFCHWNAVRNFLDNIPSGSIVLDNGCGNGKYLQYRPDIIFIGNDMCMGLLEVAKNKSDVTRSNGLSLPYRNEVFDSIICIAVFHHLSQKERRDEFIKEMIRVVKPGGKILITVWATDQSHKRVRHWNVQSNGDALIPWKDKKGKIVSLRYYHLFTQTELLRYFQIPEIQVLSCIFEFDNWCLEIQKL